MSYKFSKGSQIIGDLKAADDTQRDTKIDFGEDYIGLETSGSVRMVISGSDGKVGIGTATPDYTLDVAGDIGVNQYIYHNGDANTWINFTDNRIRLNAGGNNFIDCEDPGSAPHKVRINNGGNNIDFVIKDNSGNVYFTADASTSKIGIGTDTPSHKLDVDGDIRVRGNDIRDNSGNPAITFDGSANTSIVNDLTVGGNVFDANNKSVIKLIDHGACVIDESNSNERFLPDDIFHDYNGSNLYTTNAPPFSGSVDKLVVRGVNNSDLSLLGNLTAKVRIAGEGTDGYDVDTDNHCSNIESVTINSSDLGPNKNCVFNFTGSNFTPQDIYAITLTPTNNWNNGGDKYINFTIVTSYIID
jgi:hypothetical protein